MVGLCVRSFAMWNGSFVSVRELEDMEDAGFVNVGVVLLGKVMRIEFGRNEEVDIDRYG